MEERKCKGTPPENHLPGTALKPALPIKVRQTGGTETVSPGTSAALLSGRGFPEGLPNPHYYSLSLSEQLFDRHPCPFCLYKTMLGDTVS